MTLPELGAESSGERSSTPSAAMAAAGRALPATELAACRAAEKAGGRPGRAAPGKERRGRGWDEWDAARRGAEAEAAGPASAQPLARANERGRPRMGGGGRPSSGRAAALRGLQPARGPGLQRRWGTARGSRQGPGPAPPAGGTARGAEGGFYGEALGGET